MPSVSRRPRGILLAEGSELHRRGELPVRLCVDTCGYLCSHTQHAGGEGHGPHRHQSPGTRQQHHHRRELRVPLRGHAVLHIGGRRAVLGLPAGFG